MPIEIERKFLVVGAAWRAAVARSRRMVQGYLVAASAVTSGASRSSVRVRIAGDEAWINIKSSTLGVERQEFEYAIPHADAQRMLATLCDGVVDKWRHYVPVEGHEFEVDEFLGENAGLVVAELELDRVDAVGDVVEQARLEAGLPELRHHLTELRHGGEAGIRHDQGPAHARNRTGPGDLGETTRSEPHARRIVPVVDETPVVFLHASHPS